MKNRLTPLLVALVLVLPMACTAGDDTASSGGAASATSSSQADTDSADSTQAEKPADATPDEAAMNRRLRERLQERRPNLDIESVRSTPVDGMHEVVSGGQVFYVTADARYLLSGNLIDLEKGANLTRKRQSELAHAVVDKLDRSDMVVFEPAHGPARAYMTVFTDPTCAYCERLHKEVLNMVAEYPVEVRYAMYPRAGPDSRAGDMMRNIWCADDPPSAMTRAKAGQSVPQRDSDCKTPMARHWKAAQEIGVRSTPYLIIGDNGPIVPGYRPEQQLLKMMGIDPDRTAEAETASSE